MKARQQDKVARKGLVQCPKCGGWNQPDALFCRLWRRRWLVLKDNCVEVLHGFPTLCYRCGRWLPGKARYCGNCGVKVEMAAGRDRAPVALEEPDPNGEKE